MPAPLPAIAIGENLERVRFEIERAAESAARPATAVRLIAVSKTHTAEAIATAASFGQRDFGESTAQEATPKTAALKALNLDWHFIGHLQSNKAKFIPGHFSWLHSLDSLALADRLDRLATDSGRALNVLIEVNVIRDPSKHGVAPEQLLPLVAQLLQRGHRSLRLGGLMAVGPNHASEPERRRCFAELRELRDRCASDFGITTFSELSMGMSDDFREAILEGSTMVRIGSAIFGQREYPVGRGPAR